MSDPDEHSDGPEVGGGRRRLFLAVAAAVVVAALGGYAVGWARGSADLDRGVSATTSIVAAPAPLEAPPPTTPDGPDPTALAEVTLPTVPLTVVSFDDGIADSANGADLGATPGWTTADGAARPPADTAPSGDGSPLLGEAPSIIATTPGPATVVEVELVAPAPGSTVALAIDGDRRWQLTVAENRGEVILYEVQGQAIEQRGALSTDLPAGTRIGLFQADDRIGITVDGQPRQFRTFFGNEDTVDAAGLSGDAVAILAGSPEAAFGDLSFG